MVICISVAENSSKLYGIREKVVQDTEGGWRKFTLVREPGGVTEYTLYACVVVGGRDRE